MTDLIELLIHFGLSRQEARIYYLLLTEGNMSGYEAAKRAGLSRSNVYGALSGLVEKGAAYVIEEQSVRYQPVPVKEFCDNKLRTFGSMAQQLDKLIPEKAPDHQNYVTIHGRQNIEDKCRNILAGADLRVYFSISADLMPYYEEELKGLVDAGKKVVLLTEEDFRLDGAIHYARKHEDGQVQLIADSQYALTGEFTDEIHSTALFSANPNLVKLLKTSLANEIKLITMSKDQSHRQQEY